MKKVLAVLLAMTLLCGCADDYAVSTAVTTSPDVEASEDADTSADTEPLGPFQFFTVEDIEGNEVTHEVFADADLTVINIWGTFCGPCIQEMPDLGALSQEYAEKNVQFIGLVGDAFDSQGNIDAAIVLNDRLRDEDASTLVKRSLPLVFMDREISLPGVGSITLDNRTGTEQQVAYLAHTGHKRIAYLRGPDNHDGSERYEAFRQAMEAAQLPVDDALVMDGQFARKVAYNCVYYMMRSQRDNPPDAILCANDEMALGCLDALNDLGYTVPRDVSVLGFDDMGTENCTPPLTTVSYSMRDFARMAVEEAIRLIGDPQSNGLSQTLKTELRLRNSVSFRYGDIPDLK